MKAVQQSLLAAFALFFAFQAGALTYSDRWRSPRNAERAVRKATTLVVLHTTEAGSSSSLRKLSERGEAHYCVVENGTVYKIVDRDREAFHAGRSMWNGREDCDKFSVGIEVVGYHDKPLTGLQLDALKELIAELKKTYKLTDDKFVTHSQVAYGAPNKWHPRKHRGRKQCGMLFAMPSVRARLGLKKRMALDPDVKARRLVVGDKYLEGVLYGKTDTMKGRLPAPGTAAPQKSDGVLAGIGAFLAGAPKAETEKAEAKKPEAKKPEAKKAEVKTPPPKKPEAKKPEPKLAETKKQEQKKPPVPVTPPSANQLLGADGKPKTIPRTKAELDALEGYTVGGPIGPGKTAIKIAGAAWRKPTTYYLIRNHVIPGDKIDEKHIEKGTMVYFKK